MSSIELRKFGAVMALVLAGGLGWLLPAAQGQPARFAWIAAGGAFGAAAALAPAVLGPVHRFWLAFGERLGHVNARILLSLVFFVVVTPLGLARRMLGRDDRRRSGQDVDSARLTHDAPYFERPY